MCAALLYSICCNDIEYLRIVRGKDNGINRKGDSINYREYVLVKNAPWNDFERSKMMLAYFDSAGPSLGDISRMSGIKYYHMRFYESTYKSRKFFMEASKCWTEKTRIPDSSAESFNKIEAEVHLGVINIFLCDSNPAKWVVEFEKKVGISEDGWSVLKATILQNECETHLDYAKEDDELVKYYVGLKEKKHSKH